jgi:hypothetical protein
VGFFHLVCFAESFLLLSAGTNRDARAKQPRLFKTSKRRFQTLLHQTYSIINGRLSRKAEKITDL